MRIQSSLHCHPSLHEGNQRAHFWIVSSSVPQFPFPPPTIPEKKS